MIMVGTLLPNIFKAPSPMLATWSFNENDISEEILRRFLSTSIPPAGSVSQSVIGLAPTYGTGCRLATLSFSTASGILHITFSKNMKRAPKKCIKTRELLQRLILGNSDYDKVSFRMDRLVAALFLDLNLGIDGGIDLLAYSTDDRHSIGALLTALGGEGIVNKQQVVSVFLEEEGSKTKPEDTMMQSWAAYRAAVSLYPSGLSDKSPRIVSERLASSVSILAFFEYWLLTEKISISKRLQYQSVFLACLKA